MTTGRIATGYAEWEQQGKYLWVGHLNGMPLGTIEHGHRFTFIGVDGTVRGGFTTLSAAQQAHARREADVPADRRSTVSWALTPAAVVVAAVALTGGLLAAASSLL